MPKRATENADAPPAEIAEMAREFARAFVRELRAQLNGNTAPAITETPTGKKAQLAKERAFELFKCFDQLPDDAYVPFEVVLLLEGRISKATGYRRIRAGALPQPEYRGFHVGTLRAARREARAVPANLAERRAHQARASAAGVKAKQSATDTA